MRTDKPERKAAQRDAERLQREIDKELSDLRKAKNVTVFETEAEARRSWARHQTHQGKPGWIFGAPDAHCPVGYGATEQEAIDDLLNSIEERAS